MGQCNIKEPRHVGGKNARCAKQAAQGKTPGGAQGKSTTTSQISISNQIGSSKRTSTCPKYCLYLYVRDTNKLCPMLQGAKDCAYTQNWGGLHCTLCSFAALHTERSRFKHGGDLKQCMQAMYQAASATAQSNGLTQWRCAPGAIDTWYLDSSQKVIVGINPNKDPVLQAMGKAHAKFNLSRGDEKMSGLHLTLGPLAAYEKHLQALVGKDEVKQLITKCQAPAPAPLVQEIRSLDWELLIVKDNIGKSPHTVTDKEERVALTFVNGAIESK